MNIESLINQKNIYLKSKDGKERLPEYEDDFGHVAERIIRESLKNKEKVKLIVDKIEPGLKTEDIKEKVDFWIKFKYIDEPLGIQYTCSDSEKKIKNKREELTARNWIAKKEKRENPEINWVGNANVVLVRGDKIKLARWLEKSETNKISISEIVEDKFIEDFFNQIMVEIKEINPPRALIIYKAIQHAYKEAGKKSKEKKS